MKIGILTYWGVANYGAWAQAYALNRVVSKSFPQAEVEHVAYLERSHWEMYYAQDEKGLNNFGYNWKDIHHSSTLTEKELEEYECDVLITGADSIWEEIVIGNINHDWHLIGCQMNRCRHIISYAPSSGTFEGIEYIPDEMIEGLKAYNAISVRDKITQNLVKKAIDIRPAIVVDPVLLWDFKRDENVRKPLFDKYIAVYGCNWEIEFIENTKKFAKSRQLKLVSIGFVNDWCDISFKRIELRAFEWVGMFSCAEYVVTSTFHGLMMGISFEKPIKFCQVDYVKNRSQTLCEVLKIPNHVETYDSEINYVDMRGKLAEIRNESLRWLDQTLVKCLEG